MKIRKKEKESKKHKLMGVKKTDVEGKCSPVP